MTDWVFGYGSLVTDLVTSSDENGFEWFWANLGNHRRDWGAGMENAAADADWKYYVDSRGTRPDIVVAFLDAYPHSGSSINGVVFAVDESRLREIDRREVRYSRVDVTDLVTTAGWGDGRVWTYRGSEKSREVALRGRREDRAFVSMDYAAHCRHGFSVGGEQALHQFQLSTDPLDLPLRELTMFLSDPG